MRFPGEYRGADMQQETPLSSRRETKPSQAITRNRPPACWAQSAQRARPRVSAWHSAAYAAMRLAEAPNARGPSCRTSLAGQGGGALAHPAAPDLTRYALYAASSAI